MKLIEAFNIQRGDTAALVGAGGKTSTMAALAHELAARSFRVIATTTTRIAHDELPLFPSTVAAPDGVSGLPQFETSEQPVFVYKSIERDKANGVSLEDTKILAEHADVLLLEGDGARRLFFKMPREREPVIPAHTTVVISIVSYQVLGKPLDSVSVYNAAGIIDIFDYLPGEPIRSKMVARVMRDERGGLKGAPENARVIPFINGVPREGYARARARFIAQQILQNPRVDRVVIGDSHAADPVYEVVKRTGAVVLAAGLSTRMGTPKVLLEWTNGETILDHILCQLRNARVDEICVVTGNHAEEVTAIAERHSARAVYNANYATGEMLSSVNTGLRAMPDHIASALIVLGDQPTIRTEVVKRVVRAYCTEQARIIAPSYDMRRGHPILMDRSLWEELYALPEGGAPRDVLNRHSSEITYVNVADDAILRDVDTPQQYDEEFRRAQT